MALSDAQIDRFSRQIILPQIGPSGQQRLLQSSIALAGDGALAELAALYLAGAGIGRITLHGGASERLRAQLLDLTSDTLVDIAAGALGSADGDLLVACDLTVAAIDRAAAGRRALVAGGSGGWLVVADGSSCAGCAARAARRRVAAPASLLAGPTVGVVGALISLAVLKRLLGLGAPAPNAWLQFDPQRSTLTQSPLTRDDECPLCAA